MLHTCVVEVWQTSMPWPLGLAVHTWFVTRYDGHIDRYEVWATLGKFSGNTVVKNAIAPEAGFRSSFLDNPTNPKKVGVAKKVWSSEGHTAAVSEHLFRLIHQSEITYPFTKKYRMWPGPNSNTYVDWILRQVPEVTYRLPWNAFGKNYKE